MENLLFKNFLTDRRLYGRVQARWRNSITALGTAHAVTITLYLNPNEDFDGNPIFNGAVAELGRGVRIIQGDPAEAEGIC
jgi:hypothetical protein